MTRKNGENICKKRKTEQMKKKHGQSIRINYNRDQNYKEDIRCF